MMQTEWDSSQFVFLFMVFAVLSYVIFFCHAYLFKSLYSAEYSDYDASNQMSRLDE